MQESDLDSAVFRDPSRPLEERIEDLLSRMTLREKAGQMLHASPAVPRLGIPEYNWWSECLHGVARNGRATVFPQPIGLGATFDVELVGRVASAISDEARAKHHAAVRRGNRGRYAGLTFWTPTINIFRDPRWGRGCEGYGEDPLLTGCLGAAFVRGLQGDDEQYLKVAACAKHFAVHSGPEGARHSFNAVVGEKDLHETYLPAFKALVDAGVEAVMGAYNRTNDEPCCGSRRLLVEILREAWGFRGHVVSDCWAVEDFHTNHKVTAGVEESVALAINHGCDLCCGDIYGHILQAVRKGLVDEAAIDASMRRLLRTRFRLGMFDPPESVPYAVIPEDVINCDAHRDLAREAALKSMVLLKNRDHILPLNSGFRSLLVVGPNATSVESLMGNYAGMSAHLTTILEGIVGRAPEGMTVDYRPGCLLDRDITNPVDWSQFEARNADVTIAVLGINPLLEGEEGDAIASQATGDRETIELPENQRVYLKKLAENDKPLIVVLTAGSALAVPDVAELADAILYAWYPGEEGGRACAEILFGDVSPSGRLPITIPRSTGQLPPFEDYAMANRTYRYMTESPLYPFGFGLSYTQFAYGPLRLTTDTVSPGETLEVELEVTNIGETEAEDVVQFYLSEADPLPNSPRFSLAGFRRALLSAGASTSVSFVVTPEMMSRVHEDGRRVMDSRRLILQAGGASPGPRSTELGAAKMSMATFAIR